jgi:DMSO/TMAO reductase YedYZ heme-binding membrane subunit
MFSLPLIIAFKPDILSQKIINNLYEFSHITILLVMIIRPLADIFIKTKWIRPLVILRKGVGVLSASIIASFIFSKIIMNPTGYFGAFDTAKYWSLQNLALFAHLADISAIILLITSNNLSKRILGNWWKRIQRLSYIYFYASSLYIFIILGNNLAFISICIVTILTIIAYAKNHTKSIEEAQII